MITNKEAALIKVREDGLALEKCSPELRADREAVLATVRQSGIALKYVSDHFKSDRDVMQAAVKHHAEKFFDVDDDLIEDDFFLRDAIYEQPKLILYTERARAIRVNQRLDLAKVKKISDIDYQQHMVPLVVNLLEIQLCEKTVMSLNVTDDITPISSQYLKDTSFLGGLIIYHIVGFLSLWDVANLIKSVANTQELKDISLSNKKGLFQPCQEKVSKEYIPDGDKGVLWRLSAK